MDPEGPPEPGLELLADPVNCAMKLESGVDGPARVVLVGHGNAEQGHDAVPQKLVDEPTVALDGAARRVLDPLHDDRDLLRIHSLVEGGVVAEIREEHGGLPPLAPAHRLGRLGEPRDRDRRVGPEHDPAAGAEERVGGAARLATLAGARGTRLGHGAGIVPAPP